MVPWINSENQKSTYKSLKKTKCPVVMGHLELNGFAVNNMVTMDHGTPADIFKRFEKVFSGHFHTRSHQEDIHYLGNPYELYWHDVEETKGFHFFDTETLEHTPVDNPYKLFYKIYYEDTPYQTFDAREYENKIVKVIVKKKTDKFAFEKFIDKLYSIGVAELKVVENFQLVESKDFEVEESEDTLSILDRYIQESETELDKSVIQEMIKEIYQESCELV